jgi:hypothetical protein
MKLVLKAAIMQKYQKISSMPSVIIYIFLGMQLVNLGFAYIDDRPIKAHGS